MSTFAPPPAAVEAAPPEPTLWQAVRASLRGDLSLDYTRLPIGRAVVLLGVPMALELAMESTFGLVDIFFVGRLGSDAVATVGLTDSVGILIFAVCLGLSIGTTALVARRIGEGDREGAASAAGQGLLLGVLCALPLSALGALLAPRILEWMGGGPAVVEGWIYTAISFGAAPTIFLLFLNNAIFRGAGDAAIAMRSLWLANLINMVLDPCLIFGLGPFPELGLAGAAIATAIGRGCGVAFQFWALFGGDRRVHVRLRQLVPDFRLIRRLARVAVPGVLQYLAGMASWIAVVRIVAALGETTLAGYVIALRLIHFAILPAWGFSNAASTMVGQNLGAKQPDRAEGAVYIAGRYNFLTLSCVAVVSWLAAPLLIGFFTAEPATAAAGVRTLRIASLVYLVSGHGMSFAQAFNGAGDTDTPTWINIVVFWFCRLPLAYGLALPLGLGLEGVLTAIVVSMAVWTFVGWRVFRRGRWKLRAV